MTDAELKSNRLSEREPAQPLDKFQQSARRRKFRMPGRRNAIPADWHPTGGSDLRRHFGCWKHAAMAGFRTLAELDLYHLDLRLVCLLGKPLG